MSITDPITIEYNEKWGYYCQQGRETFHNDKNEWITFETEEEAEEFRKKLQRPKQKFVLGVKSV